MHNDPISESLNRSRLNLEKASNTMGNTASREASKVNGWRDDSREPQMVERRDPPVQPEPDDRTHIEARSDYNYDSPYGRFDRNNYHAVCVDINDKIYFLAGESKQELEKKVNTDDNIKDVLAVYGGNLICYHERRYIHLD